MKNILLKILFPILIGLIVVLGFVIFGKKMTKTLIPPVAKVSQQIKTPFEKKRTNYVVIVKKDSEFESEAVRFAQAKTASILYFSQDLSEVTDELRDQKPLYTAIVATPQDLTPDFVDKVDLILRDIDPDPYLDTAFGIITSRNLDELEKYVDRLIAYAPKNMFKIYGVAPKYTYRNLETDFGIDLTDHCLKNCAGNICICNDEKRATLPRIKSGYEDSDIIVMDVHGSPGSMELDNGEYILGSPKGLIGKAGETEYRLNNNAVLTIAESCMTGRISGKPTTVDTRYDDLIQPGEIDKSLVLSFLQSGTLNYVAATHVANTAILPEETLIEESFLQSVPIGMALKDLKNRYIMVTERYKVSMPGGPANTDQFTRDFVLFQVRNWILFGDPSVVLSTSRYKPINCIKNYSEKQSGNKKEVKAQIEFSANDRLLGNSQYIDKVEKEDITEVWGSLGADVCVIKTPYVGKLKTIRIVSASGINERFNELPYIANAFYDDLGEEVFVQIPWYVVKGGMAYKEPILLKYEITTE